MNDAGREVSEPDNITAAPRIKGIIYPEENLPPVANAIAGFQHVIAMFGSTVLGPLLMGFDPNVAIFFSGIATLLFFVMVRGKVPSYLGSSFAFIAAVIAATSYAGNGPNLNIPIALGGIIAAGVAYAAIGLMVMLIGYKWIDRLMPPVVTGTIVAIIGLNLAPVAVGDISKSEFNTTFGLLTIFLVALSAAYLPQQFLRRIPILIGGGIAYALYYYLCNLRGLGTAIDFSAVATAPWLGLPHFVARYSGQRRSGSSPQSQSCLPPKISVTSKRSPLVPAAIWTPTWAGLSSPMVWQRLFQLPEVEPE